MFVATATQDGLFGAADRTKLTGIEAGATKITTDNIRAATIIPEKAPADSIGLYPVGMTMFSTAAVGWPEAAGVVETKNISATDNAQFFYGRNSNRYTRYWQGEIAVPAWTSWGSGFPSNAADITGLDPRYVSATEIRFSSGEAYIPAFKKNIVMSSEKAFAPTGLAANTWVYFYLFANADGTGNIEMSTVEPSAPYLGTARTKGADTSRRYVGETRIHNTTAANWAPFQIIGDLVFAGEGWNVILLNNQTTTTTVTLSCINVIPITVQNMFIRWMNLGVGAFHQILLPSLNGNSVSIPPPNSITYMLVPTSSSRQIQAFYGNAPSSGGAYITGYGYTRSR